MKFEYWQEDGGDSACPPIPPLRFVITTYYLFERLLHFGGANVPLVKFLLNVQLDLEHFYRA